jgi:hypothetical protein
MGKVAGRQDDLIRAVDRALAGDWDAAHDLAQRHEGDALADWLHAVLHKLQGDTGNSRYWYRRTPHTFEEFEAWSWRRSGARLLSERHGDNCARTGCAVPLIGSDR